MTWMGQLHRSNSVSEAQHIVYVVKMWHWYHGGLLDHLSTLQGFLNADFPSVSLAGLVSCFICHSLCMPQMTLLGNAKWCNVQEPCTDKCHLCHHGCACACCSAAESHLSQHHVIFNSLCIVHSPRVSESLHFSSLQILIIWGNFLIVSGKTLIDEILVDGLLIT